MHCIGGLAYISTYLPPNIPYKSTHISRNDKLGMDACIVWTQILVHQVTIVVIIVDQVSNRIEGELLCNIDDFDCCASELSRYSDR